jgi:hypothetical protein
LTISNTFHISCLPPKKIVSQSELESVWEVNLLADKKIKKKGMRKKKPKRSKKKKKKGK